MDHPINTLIMKEAPYKEIIKTINLHPNKLQTEDRYNKTPIETCFVYGNLDVAKYMYQKKNVPLKRVVFPPVFRACMKTELFKKTYLCVLQVGVKNHQFEMVSDFIDFLFQVQKENGKNIPLTISDLQQVYYHCFMYERLDLVIKVLDLIFDIDPNFTLSSNCFVRNTLFYAAHFFDPAELKLLMSNTKYDFHSIKHLDFVHTNQFTKEDIMYFRKNISNSLHVSNILQQLSWKKKRLIYIIIFQKDTTSPLNMISNEILYHILHFCNTEKIYQYNDEQNDKHNKSKKRQIKTMDNQEKKCKAV